MNRHAVTPDVTRDMSRCHAHVTESRPVPSRPVSTWPGQLLVVVAKSGPDRRSADACARDALGL